MERKHVNAQDDDRMYCRYCGSPTMNVSRICVNCRADDLESSKHDWDHSDGVKYYY